MADIRTSSLSNDRPRYHFTPRADWINDPNGLVFHQGLYHLFFQYHPNSLDWGPMHWGHATSADLLHWQEHEVALAPDDLGMIFSGSAVLDIQNSTGFAPEGKAPLVAIFTHCHPTSEAQGIPHQHQSLAYSNDEGKTWQKYEGNPVLKSPGIKDFRDPKVFWHSDSERWVMSLACGDHIAFYASPDLKTWKWLSDFGQKAGAHGGVWECPDLVALPFKGRERWVLLVSLNPGGPQGGSATQYFVGDFDGQTFTPEHTDVRWLDWGTDHYAGVTWSNTPGRCLLIAWMSNWLYASQVPTSPWRGAMTLPRELHLQEVDGQTHLCTPVAAEIAQAFQPLNDSGPDGPALMPSGEWRQLPDGAFRLQLMADAYASWCLQLRNESGQAWRLSFDADKAQYMVDRTEAQVNCFHPEFAVVHCAPRLSHAQACEVTVYADSHSLETIADQGLTSITSLVFPDNAWTGMFTQGNLKVGIASL
jgi:fructan beta-fructosidase